MDPIEQVRAFAEAADLEGKWSSARQMMSAKAKPSGELFYSLLQQGFEGLGHISERGDDSDRLVAIDLLVRIPASMKNNKRVQEMASDVRRRSLSRPLPALSIISEKKSLPGSAKPAEVRENVADALKDASGDWVLPYAFRSLGDEDRSQRCRLALAREIAAQEPSIDSWCERLIEERGLTGISTRESVLDAVKKQDVSKLEILAVHASIREPVAAGATQFEDFIDASASPKAKRLMLVIDAGAGTTDFALFQSFYEEKTESSSLALISSAVRMSRVAGNRFDHALRPMLLRACNVQPENGSPWNAEDFAIIKADLDSQIRALKRQLFTVGSVSISLRPGASGLLTLAEVVAEPSYLELGRDLRAQRDGLLDGAFTDENIRKYHEATKTLGRPVPIHVLLTGGSSKLPIIAELAEGEASIRGVTFKFERIDELPQWIDALPRDLSELTAQEFSQCAVAIGGCAPQLPNERKDLFAPVTSHVQQGKWVLSRYQVRGL